MAETAETLNVSDAYTDPRFNKAIDEQTGYVTRNILCMPICIRGQVIGVVQMVNKTIGSFTKVSCGLGVNACFPLLTQLQPVPEYEVLFVCLQDDEEAFETFSVYCGLALHHAKLYDKIRRSEQKYKVALEVLSYHNSSSVSEVEGIIVEPIAMEDEEISK